jgi:hypothetical protein
MMWLVRRKAENKYKLYIGSKIGNNREAEGMMVEFLIKNLCIFWFSYLFYFYLYRLALFA